jgi:hypothetical protein
VRGTKVERSPGVWQLRRVHGGRPGDWQARQVSRTFTGTNRQADAALAEFVGEVVDGTAPLGRSTTFSRRCGRWTVGESLIHDHFNPGHDLRATWARRNLTQLHSPFREMRREPPCRLSPQPPGAAPL